MKSLKPAVRIVLKNYIDLNYRIKVREPNRETMNKRIFIKIIKKIKEIEERRDFLADEIGLDMTQYEDQFFAVIENLFKLAFNKSQLGLIQMYLYQLLPDKDWDGKITIEQDKSELIVDFKSPIDVWNVIKKFNE